MGFEQLAEDDIQIIGECLHAAANGPFFPDWEFSILFGMQKSDVRNLAAAWPDLEKTSEDVDLAVNNSLVNLVGYPHRKQAIWSQWISVPQKELIAILGRWRGEKPRNYFDGLK